MVHKIDWSKFPGPWRTIGPILQLELRKDILRILTENWDIPIKNQLKAYEYYYNKKGGK